MEFSPDTAQRSQSSFLGGESEENVGGMTMNPPAFQLMANEGGTNANANSMEEEAEEELTPAVVTNTEGTPLIFDEDDLDSIPYRSQIYLGPAGVPSGWYPVTYNGQMGWVNPSDVSTTVRDYDTPARVTKRGGAEYSFGGNKLGDIPEGTEISVATNSNPLWYHIAYNNLAGYIHANNFTLSSEFMVPAKVTSPLGTELKDDNDSLSHIPHDADILAEIYDDGDGWTTVSYESGGETHKGKIQNDDFRFGDGGNDSFVPAILLKAGGIDLNSGRAGTIHIPEGANILAEAKETDQNETYVKYNGKKGHIPNSSFFYAHSRGNEMQPAIVTKTGGATMVFGSRSILIPQGASFLAEEELDSNGFAKTSFRGGFWYLKPTDFAFTNIEEEDYFTPELEPLPAAPETDQNENANSEGSSNANSNANAGPIQGADVAVPTRNGVVSNPQGYNLEHGYPRNKFVPTGSVLDLLTAHTFPVGDYYWAAFDGANGYIKVEDVTPVTPRFAYESTLITVLLGTSDPLETGASGSEISIVQQALLELGYLNVVAHVTGTFDANTASALKMFQEAKGLAESEKLDSPTMASLNSQFVDHGAENIILDGTRDDVLGKTRNISESEENLFRSAIDKSGTGGGGIFEAPEFENTVDGMTFQEGLIDLFKSEIDRLYDKIVRVGDKGDRNEDNVFSWDLADGVASKAKDAVDSQFGQFNTGPILSGQGQNPFLKDVYDDITGRADRDTGMKARIFGWRMERILNHTSGRTLLNKHNAFPSRPEEKRHIELAGNIVFYQGNYVEKAFEIERNWEGFNDANGIAIQRFKPRDENGQVNKQQGREAMWDLYHTVLHEYFHALEHDDHKSYRIRNFPGSFGDKTLFEGIVDYFAQIVVNNTSYDSELRAEVEGIFHESEVEHFLVYKSIYDEAKIAERVAGIIGFPNLCAAFFLGQTELYENSQPVQDALSDSSAES